MSIPLDAPDIGCEKRASCTDSLGSSVVHPPAAMRTSPHQAGVTMQKSARERRGLAGAAIRAGKRRLLYKTHGSVGANRVIALLRCEQRCLSDVSSIPG